MSIDFKPRQPKGIPVGGQFATVAHSEPGFALKEARFRQSMAERRELLRSSGYVPATTLHALTAPTTTEPREEWWDRNLAAAEYRAPGNGYRQMPDDYTPARSLGQAMSGHRRTHRMNYGNQDVQLRLPSATAIKRFSEEHRNATFDVPISVSLHGGAPVQAWVRVTRTGPHQWETTALGPQNDGSAQVSEAVAAVLEARRPSVALLGVNDLLEAHRRREAERGAAMTHLNSSFIDEVGYDEATGTMATRIGTRLYGHRVTRDFYQAVRDADRPGAVFNKLIKPRRGAGVQQCDRCGRFSSTEVAHRCARGHKPAAEIDTAYTEKARKRAGTVAASRSRGVDLAALARVVPAPPPVNTAPGPGMQPVPLKKTGLPGRRRTTTDAPVGAGTGGEVPVVRRLFPDAPDKDEF